MGSICDKCSKKKTNTLINVDNMALDARPYQESTTEKEVEIEFKNYKSSFDTFFKKIDNYSNILTSFALQEYIMLMNKHTTNVEQGVGPGSIEINLSGMSSAQPNLNSDELDKMEYLLYFENEIMRNPKVIEKVYNKSSDGELILKDYMSEIIDSLVYATIDNFKHKNPGVKVKKGSIKSIKKTNLNVIPLLYCNSSNRGKVNFLFTSFAKEGNFVISEELLDFIYYLFILPSTVGFRAIKNVAAKHTTRFNQISDEDYSKKTDAFEISDIYRLRDIFINEFFNGKDSLPKVEFNEKFETGDFGWIFSPAGIRMMLEKHNDVKENIEVSS